MALSQYRVPSSLDEVFYIPEFITEREEEYLLRKVGRVPRVLPQATK